MATHTSFGVDPNSEIDQQILTRDPRPVIDRVFAKLVEPIPFVFFQGAVILITLIYPFFAILFTPINLIMVLSFYQVSVYRGLPLKIPTGENTRDPMESGQDGKPKPPKGILFVGNLRPDVFNGGNKELWLSADDIKAHSLELGTTGAGKTMMLLGKLIWHALCWSSGSIFVDGKASVKLPHLAWALARRCGRDDDLLVINFMQGGQDGMMQKKTFMRKTNTMNPLARGSAEFISSLVTSMMPEITNGGDSVQWRDKAIGMIEALVRVLVYMRERGEIEIDAGVIRDSIELERLVELSERSDLPSVALVPIRAYLKTAISLNIKQYKETGIIPQEVMNQHGYLANQFNKLLGTLNDSYGHIFRNQLPEVDMMDVTSNNRLLFVLIPSLEKSETETEGLGRMVIAVLCLIMAINLGSEIEGSFSDIVENRITDSPSPFPIGFDELGTYFSSRLPVIFSQGRELEFAATASGQDYPALTRGGKLKEGVDTVAANAGFKNCMKLEDAKDTFELFSRPTGKAIVAVASGFAGKMGMFNTNYWDMMNVSFEQRERLTIQEMREQKEGQGILQYRSKILRANLFYVFRNFKINRKAKLQVNRFLKVNTPKILEMREQIRTAAIDDAGNRIWFNPSRANALLEFGVQVNYDVKDNQTLLALQQSTSEVRQKITLAKSKKYSPAGRCILLYERFLALVGSPEKIVVGGGVIAGVDSSGGGKNSARPDAPVKRGLARMLELSEAVRQQEDVSALAGAAPIIDAEAMVPDHAEDGTGHDDDYVIDAAMILDTELPFDEEAAEAALESELEAFAFTAKTKEAMLLMEDALNSAAPNESVSTIEHTVGGSFAYVPPKVEEGKEKELEKPVDLFERIKAELLAHEAKMRG